MTSKFASRKVLSCVQGRLYSAQASAKIAEPQKVVLQRQETKVSRLSNGLVVASLENYSPITRVGIIVNAGSRHETAANRGATHCLRSLSDQSSADFSGFGLTRAVQQAGGNISFTSSKDYLLYTLECNRDALPECMPLLNSVATRPAFKSWEVRDWQGRMKFDLEILKTQPNIRVLELLHRCAFRTTLGNSLYAPEHRIGQYTPEMLHQYISDNFSSGRTAIVGLGVDHETLVSQVSKVQLPGTGAATVQAAKFYGGERGLDTGSPVVYAAVAAEGLSFTCKEFLSLAVLQRLMGSCSNIKWSDGLTTNKLAQGAASETKAPFSVSCFNASYSDAGLFGFLAAAPSSEIGKVLKGALRQFREVAKASVNDKDLARAKTQVVAAAQMQQENSRELLEDLAVQALYAEQMSSVTEVNRAVDAVTAADVQAVAKKVVDGKLSMAAVGDLSETPYLDQLV